MIDSFNVPDGVLQYAEWMLLPSADLHLIIGSRHGTFSRTVTSSWPHVRADIDAGHPSPLGLVTMHTADLRQIGKCHQVLAYGYRIDDAQAVTLSIYDPNTGLDTADDVWISFNAGARARCRRLPTTSTLVNRRSTDSLARPTRRKCLRPSPAG